MSPSLPKVRFFFLIFGMLLLAPPLFPASRAFSSKAKLVKVSPPADPEPTPEFAADQAEEAAAAETPPPEQNDPTKVNAINKDGIVTLAAFTVKARVDESNFDSTGLGQDEAERSDPLFANPAMMEDVGDDVLPDAELDEQLALSSGESAADLAAGIDRVNLRGFPVPERRNGFTQAGFPGGLPSASSETIRGMLVPVVGRAAPGGIRNVNTGRPRGRTRYAAAIDAATNNRYGFYLNATGSVVPKKAWYYVNARFNEGHGPQNDAWFNQITTMASVAIRHSASTSSLFMLDYVNYRGNPSAGVPEYRATVNDPIIGPYKPLVNFNSGGPNADVWRRHYSLAYQLESRLTSRIQSRTILQWTGRNVEQNRFTSGQLNMSTGKFTGIREPFHDEYDFTGLMAETNFTYRLRLPKSEHKIMAGIEATLADTERERRQLAYNKNDPTYVAGNPTRDGQPAYIRTFDPYDPNPGKWYRPAYSPEIYTRDTIDRSEELFITGALLSARSAFFRGKTVATAGLRYDRVETDIRDQRSNAPAQLRHSTDTGDQLSYHLGINQLIAQNKVLLFANTSTAFDPYTVVDARTGKMHGNESTKGFELGFKTVLLDRKFSFTLLAFYYTNDNIARRNPLYNDPVEDKDQTQPQLSESGSQEFTGFQFKTGWRITPAFTLSLKFIYTDAINTSAPATIPDEDGNEMPRLPPNTATFGLRYTIPDGKLKGLSFGATLIYVDEIVANYASYKYTYDTAGNRTEVKTRKELTYPSYVLLGLNTSFVWLNGKTRNSVSLSIRNALDTDLEKKLARPNSERLAAITWHMSL